MPKRTTKDNKSGIVLDQEAQAPLYRQLYDRLRAAILAGQLETGARLPSTRALASELGISRNTTALAYEQLLLEGYIEGRVGDGTRVARVQPEQLLHAGAGNTRKEHSATTLQSTPHASISKRGQMIIDAPFPGGSYSDRGSTGSAPFRVGQPDVTYFPYEIWAKLVARHARHSLHNVTLHQHPQGYYPLREAISAHIGITRGVYCSPEQIIMTAGSQGALDLVARTLLDPGDHAWLEDPGYPGAHGALLSAEAAIVRVPVDKEGIDVYAGRQLRKDARLAVVTPSHQFPTGVTMSLHRRLALLEWAREAQAWIIEDDYDSEYRFSGRPLDALQGLDRAGRVIYVGTFSKVLFPSLRIGYMVAPPALVPALIAARRFIDGQLPMLEQLALADFISEGHFGRHLRKMRILYLARRNALIDALTHELGDILDVSVPEAGMHLVAWLPPHISRHEVASRAAEQGLHVLTIAQSSLRPTPKEGLMLGFAAATPDELRAAVHTLALALRAVD